MKQDKTGKLEEGTPGSSDAAGSARLGQTVADAALARGEPKWTPGPWEAYLVLGFPRVIAEIGTDIADALMDGGKASGRQAEVTANAHLIAAAPDLYEALEAIVLKAGDSYVGMLYSELIGARAALVKARGEKPESTSNEADEGQEAAARSQNK